MLVMNKRTKQERVTMILYLARKLQHFPIQYDKHMNLYSSEFQAIQQLKNIFNDYINQDDSYATGRSGKIKFDELNKTIEYILPIRKNVEPTLIFRST